MPVSFIIDTAANLFSREGISSSLVTTVDFPWQARQVIIANDSSTGNCTVSIKSTKMTLLPSESLSLGILTGSCAVTPTGAYRIWAIG